MYNRLSDKLNTTKHDRGSAYLIALITLVVGLTLGLALLRAVGSAAAQSRRTIEVGNASHLADAGIAYGYWLYRYCSQSLPIEEQTFSFGSGAVTVAVDAYDALPNSAIKIDAAGTYRGTSVSRSRVVRKRCRPFEMALCSGSAIDQDNLTIQTGESGQNGDMWVNGDIILDTLSVNGDLDMAGLILVPNKTVTGTERTRAGSTYFPSISLSYYMQKASDVYEGSTTLTAVNFTTPYEVIFVNGSLSLQGPVSGTGLLVIAGNLDIVDNVEYTTPGSDKMCVLVSGYLATQPDVTLLNGFYYVWGVFKPSLDVPELAFEHGGLAASAFSTLNPTVVATADPAFRTTDLPYRMHLPGYETADL